jgi:hypothetical protein
LAQKAKTPLASRALATTFEFTEDSMIVSETHPRAYAKMAPVLISGSLSRAREDAERIRRIGRRDRLIRLARPGEFDGDATHALVVFGAAGALKYPVWIEGGAR